MNIDAGKMHDCMQSLSVLKQSNPQQLTVFLQMQGGCDPTVIVSPSASQAEEDGSHTEYLKDTFCRFLKICS